MENLLTGFVMKEDEGCERKSCFSLLGSTSNFQIQSYLQVLHCKRTSECFTITQFLFLFLQQWFFLKKKPIWLEEEFKSSWKLRCRIFEMGHHRQDSKPRPLPVHRDTQITFPLHNLVLESPSSSVILYTYTKLRTPVFSVKQCYAYLYYMYRRVTN